VQHLEPEDLALAALGEPLEPAARDHLADCAQCAAEHASLAEAVAAGRAAGPVGDGDLVPAPPSVWAAVSAELGLDPAVRPGGRAAPAFAPEAAAAAPAPARVPGTPAASETPSLTTPAPAPIRRPRAGARWLAVAAAAGVVLGGAGVRWWDERTPGPSVIEQASLAALPAWPEASGDAKVERDEDGTRRLVLSLSGAGGPSGYHEVWLIDRDVTKLVSLGVLHGDSGSFVLPDGLDLAEYPVVDVSEEPFDGDPAHSGDSIVRGVLGA
jgi:hypothetical protein